MASGALPAGLTLNASTGAIGGTPSTAQVSSNLQVRVSDADGRVHVTAPFTITVSAPLSISLAGSVSATIGTAVSTPATINGGRGPFSWSAASGGAPGVGFNTASGTFEGTPSSAGSFPASVSLVDADGRTANAATTFVVVGPLQLAAPSTTSGPPGRTFQANFQASGGTAPYTYAMASGTLPYGVGFSTLSGAVYGTPSGTGSYPIVIRVTDAAGRVATASATIRIYSPLSIAGTPTAEGRVGEAYSGTLSVSGGSAPIGASFSPALPAGLSAAINGTVLTISGTPTAAAEATYTVTMSDPDGQMASKSFALLIRAPVQNADTKLPLFSGQPDAAILTVLWDGSVSGQYQGSWKKPFNALGETEMRAAASWGNPRSVTPSDYNLFVTYDDFVNVDTVIYDTPTKFKLSYQAPDGQFYSLYSYKYNFGTDVMTTVRFTPVRSKKFMITLPQGLNGSTVRELRLGWGGNAPVVTQPEFTPPGGQTGYVSAERIDFRSTFVGTPGQQVSLSATARSAPGAGQPVTFALLPYTPGFAYGANYLSFSCHPEGGFNAPKVAWADLECQGRRTGDRNTPLDGTTVSSNGVLTIGSVPEGTRDVWISAKDAAGVENHRAVRLMQNAPGADTVRPVSASVEWERGTSMVSTSLSTISQYEDAIRYRVAADLNRLHDGQNVPSGDASRLVLTNNSNQSTAAAKRVVVTYGQPVRADGAVVSFVDAAPHYYESMAFSIYAKISGNWQRVSNWVDANGAGSEVYLPFDNLPVASTEYAVVANVDNINSAPQGFGRMAVTEFRVTYGGRNAVR